MTEAVEDVANLFSDTLRIYQRRTQANVISHHVTGCPAVSTRAIVVKRIVDVQEGHVSNAYDVRHEN